MNKKLERNRDLWTNYLLGFFLISGIRKARGRKTPVPPDFFTKPPPLLGRNGKNRFWAGVCRCLCEVLAFTCITLSTCNTKHPKYERENGNEKHKWGKPKRTNKINPVQLQQYLGPVRFGLVELITRPRTGAKRITPKTNGTISYTSWRAPKPRTTLQRVNRYKLLERRQKC